MIFLNKDFHVKNLSILIFFSYYFAIILLLLSTFSNNENIIDVTEMQEWIVRIDRVKFNLSILYNIQVTNNKKQAVVE